MSIAGKHTLFIKQVAKQLGFDHCGISKAVFLNEDARRLETWLNKGMQGNMHYMENYFDLRVDPTKLVPGAKSVITVLLNYFPAQQQVDTFPKISKYAYGEDYHEVIREKLKMLMQEIKIGIGEINGRGFVDSAPVLERSWAQNSGLGWIGKNGNLINKQAGSFFFIATLIIDLELEYDDNFAKDYIIALQRLGIFKDIEGNKFKPYDKITRGQYARWLVTSANILCPEQAITKSMAILSKNYYEDVQPNYSDFTYIQFLHDRGYIVGIDGTHFEPDKELTREELMMMRCSFEYNIQYTDIRNMDPEKSVADLQNYFRDPNDINKSYLVSFYKDMAPGFPVLNRTFGGIKKIYPKAHVTRSEAAASLGEILGQSAEKFIENLLSSTSKPDSTTPDR